MSSIRTGPSCISATRGTGTETICGKLAGSDVLLVLLDRDDDPARAWQCPGCFEHADGWTDAVDVEVEPTDETDEAPIAAAVVDLEQPQTAEQHVGANTFREM